MMTFNDVNGKVLPACAQISYIVISTCNCNNFAGIILFNNQFMERLLKFVSKDSSSWYDPVVSIFNFTVHKDSLCKPVKIFVLAKVTASPVNDKIMQTVSLS